ncbi:hypothetical protein A9G13_05625 [Gilliamella sp. wkB178]|uniref:glycosyltransferase family 9 protein n=1 Tax=Gilliamella sp. wkB178 TaxID=3120259 RepID=UPI00080E3E86|nr:glycosyltransferase family 9 protein [Gilliamella apicola]OCG07694.1 hypothetical protein A9G13_05625 [Gilliamella apicola]
MLLLIKKLTGFILKSFKEKVRRLNWKRNFITKKIKYFIYIKILTFLIFFLRKKGSFNSNEINKVLILRNDCIGDMIVTTPFIRYLFHAGYEVYVSSRKNSLEILMGNPYIKGCFLYDDKNFRTLIRSLKNIRKQHFDLAIDARFHRRLDLTHLYFCCFVKTSNLLSYNKSNIKSFNISLPYYKANSHVTNQLKYYLDNLNINYDLFNYDIFIDYGKDNYVQSFIDNLINLKKKFVVINPYGGSHYRCLSNVQIEKICDLFKCSYPQYKIIIIGQPNRLNTLCIDEIIKFQSQSIRDVIPLIKKADLVISVDTSIVHIASAFSIKCISIYMEPLSPSLDNLKSVYSRALSDYKYLQQDLLLDKKYIKKHKPDLSMQINKDLWAPNNENAKQIVFYVNSIEAIETSNLVNSINQCIEVN